MRRTRMLTSVVVAAVVLAMAGAAQGAFVAGQFGPGGTWNVYEWVPASTTWDQARVNAAASSVLGTPGHLVAIGSAAENSFVNGLGTGDRFIGLTDATGVSTLDGFNPAASLGTAEFGNTSAAAYPPAGQTPSNTPGTQRGEGWAWVTGEPLVYQNWRGGEPNDGGGEDAAIIRKSDTGWNDLNAGTTIGDPPDSNLASIVEYETNSTQQPALAGTGQIDPFSGHYYERVMDVRTWDEARVDAKFRMFGGVIGHLAAVDNANENEAVRGVGGQDNKWIGFHDSDQTSTLDGTAMGATEGTFQWVTGDAVTYTNWNTTEPNNSSGEDAAHITSGGGWNDQDAGDTLGEAADTLTSYVTEYDIEFAPQYTISYRERKAAATFTGDGQINSLTEAKLLLSLPTGHADIAAEASAQVYAISFTDPAHGGGQSGWIRAPFQTLAPGEDEDFVVEAIGLIYIPTAGDWTFGLAHDDGFELTIGTNTYAVHGTGNVRLINGANVFNFASAGYYDLNLTWYERGGGAYLQLFAAQGDVAAWDANLFELVGDTYNGGLQLMMSPEPGTLSLLAIGGLLALRRRRRK
ncbi:PEP-CTERM sorting domain-containing protein [bacterium]|nr:PEP-CTERM sorting domain-containing protein [bacterium]